MNVYGVHAGVLFGGGRNECACVGSAGMDGCGGEPTPVC